MTDSPQLTPKAKRRRPVRTTALVFVGCVVLGIAGIIIFLVFQSTKQVPLEVAIYPNATLTGSQALAPGQDRMQYTVNEDAHIVGAFYEDANEEACIYRESAEQGPDIVPFEYQCLFDGSDLGITQFTRVIVQPGIGALDGQTIIYMERVWGQ